MTREDIIRMAREAGGTALDETIVLTYKEAQRFAEMLAAAERERCAKVCEETKGPKLVAVDRLTDKGRDALSAIRAMK